VNPASIILLVVAGLAPAHPPAQVPSVTVIADPEQCARATSVQIWIRTFFPNAPPPGRTETYTVRTGLSPFGGPITSHVTFVAGEVTRGSCEWSFSGLAEGHYVAILHRADGSGGAQSFVVERDTPITVKLPPPTVTLSGGVLRGGTPVAGVFVRVVPLPFSRPTINTFTDSAGRYNVVLDGPGLHEVRAELVGALGVAEGRLRAGPNQLDVVAD
jgi:hypothetical protein